MIKSQAIAWRRRFAIVAAFIVGWQLMAIVQSDSGSTWTAPEVLFVVVVVGAGCCVVGALVLLAIGFEQDLPEVAMLGTFVFAVSALPLVHGITLPGVLYDTNSATDASVLWSIPIGLLAAAPAMFRKTPLLRRGIRNWRAWSAIFLALTVALCVLMVGWPNSVPNPRADSMWARILAVASLLGTFAFALRHLELAIIGNAKSSFFAAIGFVFIGSSSLVWFGQEPYTLLFWGTHVLDVTGVLAITVGAAHGYRQGSTMREIIAPLTVNDPLSALELGIDPLVHRFVAQLEVKDKNTRDHVVRTAEVAVRVAERMDLAPEYVRTIGIAALLHDVGKLDVPDHILTKPTSLTDDEFELVKQHTVWGERLVSGSAVLGATALIVRGHHERVDGSGYPDGLSGSEIPLGARIVSVCDAFDAMAQTRHYREGMSRERVVEILQEHRGTQWDADVVDVLLSIVDQLPDIADPSALGRVGHDQDLCGCADALPDQLDRRVLVKS